VSPAREERCEERCDEQNEERSESSKYFVVSRRVLKRCAKQNAERSIASISFVASLFFLTNNQHPSNQTYFVLFQDLQYYGFVLSRMLLVLVLLRLRMNDRPVSETCAFLLGTVLTVTWLHEEFKVRSLIALLFIIAPLTNLFHVERIPCIHNFRHEFIPTYRLPLLKQRHENDPHE